jgi:pimeloyl-ACP methyl ester carboxylesterase
MKELVFIHGSGDSARVWSAQMDYLRQLSSLRAEAIDLPGHGLRPDTLSGEVSVADYAEAVNSAIRSELQMEKPIIVGHSLGGAIALMMALLYGSLVSGLILIGTGARLRVYPELLAEARLSPAQAKRRVTEMAVLPANKDTLAQQLLQEVSPSTIAMTYRDLNACNQFDVLLRLYEMQVPTLIICGAEDRLTLPKYSEYLRQKIVGAELHVVPDAGHYVMREQPEVVNGLISEWVERVG